MNNLMFFKIIIAFYSVTYYFTLQYLIQVFCLRMKITFNNFKTSAIGVHKIIV